jgi:hypothetical protein
MESLNEVGGRLCGSHQSGSKLLPMQIKMFRRMLAYNYFKRPHTIKFEKKHGCQVVLILYISCRNDSKWQICLRLLK